MAVLEPDSGVRRLLADAAEASRAVNSLAAGQPAQVTGSDGSGQVEVRLDHDGRIRQIHVRGGWARHLDPARLGAAVIDAAEDAARTATRHWSDTLVDTGQTHVAGRVDTRAPGADTGELLDSGEVRDINELAEAVIRALQDAASASATIVAGLAQPLCGDGSDDSGHVQVTISGTRLTGCRVDEAWAARQDGHTLGAALSQAARRAAAALPAVEPVAGDQLLADVLATQRHHSGRQTGPDTAGPYGREGDR